MGHEDKNKPNTSGPKFESTAQRLCLGNEDKLSKSKGQKQNVTRADTIEVNGVKLANRFSALDV